MLLFDQSKQGRQFSIKETPKLDLQHLIITMNWCFKFQQIIFGIFILLNNYHQIDCAAVSDGKKSTLNIAVIGAGPSGLVSARHSIADGHTVTVYEQQEELGGVWVYTGQVGKNEYGVDTHTAMYKGLR